MEGFTHIETKGIVSFYKDKKGNLFQKLGCLKPFKVKDGKMTYKQIMNVRGLNIKYNNNGIQGFSIWKGKTNLEDNIWTTDEAEKIAIELSK